MSMSFMPGIAEILIIVFFGGSLGGSGLPFGLPPAENDPMLAHIAPDNCLGYISWNAMAEPDPDSPNHSEQLLAEREVQRFVKKTTSAILQKLREEASRDEQAQLMAVVLPKFLKAIVTNGTAVYVTGGGGMPGGGLFCHLGDEAKDVEGWLSQIQQTLTEEQASVESVDGRKVYNWTTAPGVPPLQWTIVDDCLLAALGDGELERLIERRKAEQIPRWLSQVAERIPVDRPGSTVHVNVAGIMEMVTPMIPAPATTGVRALGLQDLLSISTVTGLSEVDCVTRTWIRTTGRKKGLFSFLDAAPLTEKDLEGIPADVRLASVVRLEPAKLLEAALETVEEFEIQAATMARRQLSQSRDMIGLDIEEDILAALGNSWRIYQSPSEGGDPLLGWTAVVSLNRPEKLRDLTNVLKGFAAAQNRGNYEQIRIESFDAAGRTAYFVNVIGEEIPVAPAWCITDDELVVSLYPQGITSYLVRDKSAPRLSALPEVKQQLGSNAILFQYCDTAAIFDLVWPFVRGGATVLGSQLQREGIDLNVSVLPSRSSIVKHLKPATSVLTVAEDGLEIVQHRTLPLGLEPVVFSGFTLFGMRMPMRTSSGPSAVTMALSPAASRRMESTNNLKQILLAMHNYHDVYRHFPKAVHEDAEGNPGLSWRVHLLPFLEQSALYDQFHLNEPWDSEHNKKLIPLMPRVFRSPGSKADATKTNYVGFRGKGTIFENAERAIAMRDVLDGTSNTLALVEADDEHAVIWSKPDDLDFDPDSPRKGLASPTLREGFIGALTDGSVRVLSPELSEDLLRRLILRNDGEVIEAF